VVTRWLRGHKVVAGSAFDTACGCVLLFAGCPQVVSPNIFNFDLWKTSGHADHYRDNMFSFDVEKQEYGLKPMNCPGHCVMFGSKQRSYRCVLGGMCCRGVKGVCGSKEGAVGAGVCCLSRAVHSWWWICLNSSGS
jgi:hypothetical protein